MALTTSANPLGCLVIPAVAALPRIQGPRSTASFHLAWNSLDRSCSRLYWTGADKEKTGVPLLQRFEVQEIAEPEPNFTFGVRGKCRTFDQVFTRGDGGTDHWVRELEATVAQYTSMSDVGTGTVGPSKLTYRINAQGSSRLHAWHVEERGSRGNIQEFKRIAGLYTAAAQIILQNFYIACAGGLRVFTLLISNVL
ncbi:hypothetical protein B0H13DRAFT_1850062 [Mycena leptocephala]|nr:hypothetical protein B0H13DRAFT_1850062 [Mycena leptocephala]